MIIESAFIYKWLFIAANRAASWFGSGYLFRKGFKKRKKRYVVLAVLFSTVTLIVMGWVLVHVFNEELFFPWN